MGHGALLEKKGGGRRFLFGRRNWKRRWIHLDDGPVLGWWESSEHQSAGAPPLKPLIDIKGASCEVHPPTALESDGRQVFPFTISLAKAVAGEERNTFPLRADDKATRDAFICALKEAGLTLTGEVATVEGLSASSGAAAAAAGAASAAAAAVSESPAPAAPAVAAPATAPTSAPAAAAEPASKPAAAPAAASKAQKSTDAFMAALGGFASAADAVAKMGREDTDTAATAGAAVKAASGGAGAMPQPPPAAAPGSVPAGAVPATTFASKVTTDADAGGKTLAGLVLTRSALRTPSKAGKGVAAAAAAAAAFGGAPGAGAGAAGGGGGGKSSKSARKLLSVMARVRTQVRGLGAIAAASRLDVRDHMPAGLPPPPSPAEAAEAAVAAAALAEAEAAYAAAGAVFDDGFRMIGSAELDRSCAGWKRVGEIYGPETSLADDKFDPLSLGQGRIGDCYLVAACATVAAVPGFIQRLFVSKAANAAGLYLVRLWDHRSQRWEYVWLDDRFPVDKTSVRRFADGVLMRHDFAATAGKPPPGCGYVPLFMSLRKSGAVKGGNGFAFWPMLLEKAAAKLFGSFHVIGEGGTADFVMGALVGQGATFGSIPLREPRSLSRVQSGALWTQLEAMERSGFFMAAGAAEEEGGKPAAGVAETGERISANGIVNGHAYSILRVVQTQGPDGADVRLLQMRNPWGRGEWNGKCSDSDAAFWTREMRHKLNYHIKAAAEGDAASAANASNENDDGVFFITLEDFVTVFDSLYVSRWLKDVRHPDGIWHSYSVDVEWPAAVQGTHSVDFPLLDQFTITPSATGDIFVTMEACPRFDAEAAGAAGAGAAASTAGASAGAGAAAYTPLPGSALTKSPQPSDPPPPRAGSISIDLSNVFYKSKLKGQMLLGVAVNGGRRVDDWTSFETACTSAAHDPEETNGIDYAMFDINVHGGDSAFAHIAGNAGEPITIIPAANSISGQRHYRVTVHADAPLTMRPGRDTGSCSTFGTPADTAAAFALTLDRGHRAFSLLPPSQMRDPAYFARHPFATLCLPAAGADGSSGSSAGGPGSSSTATTARAPGAWSLLRYVTPLPAYITQGEGINVGWMEQLFVAVRPPLKAEAPPAASATTADAGGAAAAAGDGPAAPAPTQPRQSISQASARTLAAASSRRRMSAHARIDAPSEAQLIIMMELLDGSRKPFDKPLEEGRAVLCATDTALDPLTTEPLPVTAWSESPRLEVDAMMGRPPPPDPSALWSMDFATPPPTAAEAALGAPPLAAVAVRPRWEAGALDTAQLFALFAANVPVEHAAFARFTIATDGVLIPPGDAAAEASPPRLVASVPPARLWDDSFFRLQEPGRWHGGSYYAQWAPKSLGTGDLRLDSCPQLSVTATGDGRMYAFLAAGVKAGEDLPVDAVRTAGQIALAVTPSVPGGPPCITWRDCPATEAELMPHEETPWFNELASSPASGDRVMLTWKGKKGATYTVCALPYSWSGAADYRVSVWAEAPLAPAPAGSPNSGPFTAWLP